MPEKRPTPQQFLTDPEFQTDRDLFTAFLDDYMTKKAKLAEEERKKNPEFTNIFDRLFGGK